MKKHASLSKLLLLVVFVSIFIFISCDEDENCNDTICTTEFVVITITVKDQNQNPVILDSIQIINKVSRIPLTPFSSDLVAAPESGQYALISDGDIDDNQTLELEFKGFKNGTEIINKDYIVAADCCHVRLISGELELVVNQ